MATISYQIGDKVKWKVGSDQWACMWNMKIQKVNNDDRCCVLHIKEENLERVEDGK